LPAPLFIFHHHVGTRDIGGHQIGGELDTAELQIECSSEGTHQTGLSQTGHALQEYVPTGDHRRQHAADHGLLADDRPGHLLGNQPGHLSEFLRCDHLV
jgi:hypothetical protein